MACYAPAVNGPLVFDDYTQFGSTSSFPTWREWIRPETRPLTRLTFAIEARLLGDSPAVHRWGNVVIHWLAGLVLWKVLHFCFFASRSAAIPRGAGLVAALLWVFHPLQTQSVAYIIQRSESLMGFWYFGFLACLIEDQRLVKPSESFASAGRRKNLHEHRFGFVTRNRWRLLAVACFALGLASKTVMITVLAVGPLFDRAFLYNSWQSVMKNRGWLYIPPIAFGLLAMISIFPAIMRGEANVGFGGDAPPLPNYLAAQAKAIWLYLGSAIAPGDLNIDHGMQAPAYWSQNLLWIALTLLLACTGVVLACLGRWRTMFLVLSPLIVLSPTSSIVPTADVYVEHRMYVPLAPIVAGWVHLTHLALVHLGKSSFLSRMWPTFMGVWIVALMFRTYLRSVDYSTATQLWSQSVFSNPTNDRAIQNLIDAANREYRGDEVEQYLVQAVELCQLRQLPPTVPLQRYGELLGKSGRSQQAVSILQEAIRLDDAIAYDGYQPIQRFRDRAAMHVNLGLAYLDLGERGAAIDEIAKAFEYHDASADARAMVGGICRDAGRAAEARRHFQRALELRPNWPEVKRDLELVELQLQGDH